MDFLIKKSDGTSESLNATVSRIQLPNQTGGDVVFVGSTRPVDLGEYVLVSAQEIIDPVDANTKRGPVVTKIDGEKITVTHTVVLKTPEDLIIDVRDARRSAYPPIGDQLDALWKGGAEMAAMKQKIDDVKSAHPKPM